MNVWQKLAMVVVSLIAFGAIGWWFLPVADQLEKTELSRKERCIAQLGKRPFTQRVWECTNEREYSTSTCERLVVEVWCQP